MSDHATPQLKISYWLPSHLKCGDLTVAHKTPTAPHPISSLTSSLPTLPFAQSAPTTRASWLRLQHVKHTPVSGPLHLLSSLLGAFFLLLTSWLTPSCHSDCYSFVTSSKPSGLKQTCIIAHSFCGSEIPQEQLLRGSGLGSYEIWARAAVIQRLDGDACKVVHSHGWCWLLAGGLSFAPSRPLHKAA